MTIRQAMDALEFMRARKSTGKVVVTMVSLGEVRELAGAARQRALIVVSGPFFFLNVFPAPTNRRCIPLSTIAKHVGTRSIPTTP